MAHATIAIDGPAGTGKTTSAAGVARRLGFAYIDSGALYRVYALAADEAGCGGGGDDPRIAEVVARSAIRAIPRPGGFRVLLGGRDVTPRLRAPRISHLASVLATRPDVRAKVVEILRGLAREGPVVVEGRDIGTVVFPDAALKIYLTADLGERARRRWKDLVAMGHGASLEEVERELAERDARDSQRRLAPLQRATDAVGIDTTHLSVEGQIEAIVQAFEQRAGRRPRRER